MGLVLNGVGVIFLFFYALFLFFYALFPFFYATSPLFLRTFPVFLRFSLFLLKEGEGQNNSNLLRKWGISLRPRLHRPRVKLPEFLQLFKQPTAAGIWL